MYLAKIVAVEAGGATEEEGNTAATLVQTRRRWQLGEAAEPQVGWGGGSIVCVGREEVGGSTGGSEHKDSMV